MKKSKQIKFITVAVALAIAQAALALPALKIENNHLVDTNDRTVILHGLNEMNKQAPFEPSAIGFDERNIEFLQQNGFNVVRIGVFWTAIEPTPGHYNDAYLANIKQTIDLLAKHNIYTLIDFHQDGFSTKDGFGAGEPTWAALGTGTTYNPGFPLSYYGGMKYGGHVIGTRLDNDFTKFWQDTYSKAENEGIQEAYINMVKHTVSFFGDTPEIVGYEPMNEPFKGDGWQACKKSATNPQGGCSVFESTQLNQFSTHVSQAIHSINPNTVVWFEPNVSFGLGDPTSIGAINDVNTGFSFHDYDSLSIKTPIQHALSEQQIAHTPLFMTEFGAASSTPNQLTNIANVADKDQISWIEWAYTNNPSFKFAHFPGKPAADPREQGIVYDATKPLTGSNVKWDRLKALARPYPEFVAGTDIKYNYNTLTHVLTLTYTPLTGITQIIVPSYDNAHYKALAVGAHQVLNQKQSNNNTLSFQNAVQGADSQQVTIKVYKGRS
jgi:endoglycosylceramidase